MRIDSIYISGWRTDLRYTQCCVASIRQWYPRIPIRLIKDELGGRYSTAQLEKAFDVEILQTGKRLYGWGAGKLEPLFQRGRERFLVLDSDTVFAGPVLSRLERHDEDFIVVAEDHEPAECRENYFDPATIVQLDPDFTFPGFVFNTGQFVGTSGLLRRSDFEPYVSFGEPAKFLRPDIFKCGEQGLLNYVLMTSQQAGRLTLRREPFMRWPPCMKPGEVDVMRLGEDSPYDFLLHWAGPKDGEFANAPLAEVLLHFDRLYRRRRGNRSWLRALVKSLVYNRA